MIIYVVRRKCIYLLINYLLKRIFYFKNRTLNDDHLCLIAQQYLQIQKLHYFASTDLFYPP